MKELTFTLTFGNSKNTDRHVIEAKGFDSMHHAEQWAHNNASVMSAQTVNFWFPTQIQCGDDFVCLAVPEYYNEGVEVLSVQHDGTKIR